MKQDSKSLIATVIIIAVLITDICGVYLLEKTHQEQVKKRDAIDPQITNNIRLFKSLEEAIDFIQKSNRKVISISPTLQFGARATTMDLEFRYIVVFGD